MNPSTTIIVSILAIVVVIGCGSGTEKESQPKSDRASENSETGDPSKKGDDAETASPDSPAEPKLSPKEQYVADARQLVDTLIGVVNKVDDPASAAKALEECNALKPKAEELGATARKMMEAVRDDPAARAELGDYFRSNCHSDAELKPLIDKLGESEKSSKYPQLLKTVGELLETSMYNYF